VEEAKQGCRSLKASSSKIGEDPTKKKNKSWERSKIPTGPWFPSLFLGSLEKVLAHLGSWRLVQKGGVFGTLASIIWFCFLGCLDFLPCHWLMGQKCQGCSLLFLFCFGLLVRGSWFFLFIFSSSDVSIAVPEAV
jgi:hypothetical protein